MGYNTLAANSGVSVDEAKRIHKVMFDEFHVLRDYTDKLFAYPESHDGYINTFYGDKLRTEAWKYRFNPDGTPNNSALARAVRHGCQ